MRAVMNPESRDDVALRGLRYMVGGIVLTIILLAVVVATNGHFFPTDTGLI
ncbi:MAG TPA: hypothetical protein VG387_16955 [Rhizomicrobium sp.]|jgi:hypothetical protein|nr:hypothetical protein [Rhizomicrobium sp.]